MRTKPHFLTRHRGPIAVLAFSLTLYLLPGRFAYPVTGRIASASANVAALFQPEPAKREAAPLIEQLRRKLVLARQELTTAHNELYLLRREIKSITAVASALRPQHVKIIHARVVLRRDASNFRRTMLVNRGSKDGVRPGLPVLWGSEDAQGGTLRACVVGTVDTVGPSACRVLLASDPGFRAPARMLRSRQRVVVEGKSAGLLPMRLKHIDTDTHINTGDLVVTSGSLGLFPPGIPIGTVAKVEGRQFSGELEVALSSPVNLDELESVIIVELIIPQVQEESHGTHRQNSPLGKGQEEKRKPRSGGGGSSR